MSAAKTEKAGKAEKTTRTARTPGRVSGAQSIDRAAAVLTFAVSAADPVTFTDVVEHTGLSRSTVSRLLQALQRNSLLERGDDGAYRGGPLFTHYAARFNRAESLVAAAGSTLQRLSEETGEAAHLAVPIGDRVVQVAQVESRYLLGSSMGSDLHVPAHCSALGKVLLAQGKLPLPEEPLEQRGPRTLRTVRALQEDLEQVRERGYALTHDELEAGLDALAAPVRGFDGDVVAAVGLSGPSLRLEGQYERLGALLVREAATLSASLRRQGSATTSV